MGKNFGALPLVGSGKLHPGATGRTWKATTLGSRHSDGSHPTFQYFGALWDYPTELQNASLWFRANRGAEGRPGRVPWQAPLPPRSAEANLWSGRYSL